LEKNECKQAEAEDIIPGQATNLPCDKLHPVDCKTRRDCFLEKNECKQAEAEDIIPGQVTHLPCDKLHPVDCQTRRDCFLEKNECKQAEAEDMIPGAVTQRPCDKLLPGDCKNRRDCLLEKNECKQAEGQIAPTQPAGVMIPQCKFLTPEQCKVTKECALEREPPFECRLLEIYEDAAEGKLPPSIIADRENENVSPLIKCDDLFPNQCGRRPDCMWDYDECKKNKAWKDMSPAAQAAAMAAATGSNGGPASTTKPGATKPGTNDGGASQNQAAASCYSLEQTKCKAQSNCFWDGIGCADIGGALSQVCAKKKEPECKLTPYCMWDGVACQEGKSEVEMELMCEALVLPKDCNANSRCAFDFSEGECVSKMEYVAEFELICEGRPHPQCKGACMWKKNECVEHEPMEWEDLCPLRPQPDCNGLCTWNPAKHQCMRDKSKSKGLAKNQCYSILDEKKCYQNNLCLWLSAKCFPADEFNLAKTHAAELNDKSSNGVYMLACACFFGSCIFGWLIASFCAKKTSRLEDTLLEELNV